MSQKGGIGTKKFFKPKKKDEFGNFEKAQGSTYVVTTMVVMTTQLGMKERQLWVVAGEKS